MAANKFSDVITAKVVDNKAVALTAKMTQAPISIIGSSMTTSALHHSKEEGTGMVTLYPQLDQDGIVAVCVHRTYSNHEPDNYYGFLLVTWKEKDGQKYPFVELEEMWSPSERIGHMHEDVITVQIRGKMFSSSPYSRRQLRCGDNAARWTLEDEGAYVNDPNLLCRYLAGTASATEVLHFTTQTYAEESARIRLAEVTERKAELQTRVSELESERDDFERKATLLRNAAAPFANFFRKIPDRFRSTTMNTLIFLVPRN